MSLSPEKTGAIVAARVISPGDEVTLISSGGILLRLSGDHISRQGRASRGVRVMDLRGDDTVASVAVIRENRLIADGVSGQPDEAALPVEMPEEATAAPEPSANGSG